MKYIFLTLVFLFISSVASATDDGNWLCEVESIQKQGNVFYACGIGVSYGESAARGQALRIAIGHFKTLCNESSDCAGKPKIMDPQRLSCRKDKTVYRCAQLIKITVTEGLGDN